MVTGRQIGGYQILEELGRGAMGVVFKARQLSMDRIVAIKFLPKKLAQDERIVARFLREARAAGQLAHPNIVSVHELGLCDGLHFIAMEYVDGNSIQKKIKDRGAYSEKETLDIAAQIGEALKLAHSRGILHRDIKPDNFLIDSAGRVRLADLGLALIQSNPDGGLTQDGTTLGTPHFMSPEQCSGTHVDARSDLYSLGASMFVMATGRTPYEGTTAAAVMVKVLTEQPLSIKKIRPDLSAGFVALVEKMMHKDPTRRFQDAQSAIEAIQQCKSGLYKPVVVHRTATQLKAPGPKPQLAQPQDKNATPEKPGTRSLKANESKMMPLFLGAGAALLLLAVLFFSSRGKNPPATVQHSVATVTSTTLIKTAAPIVETHGPVIGTKTPDETHPGAENNRERHAALFIALRDLSDDFQKGKIKPAEAMKRLNDFRRDNDKKVMAIQALRRQANLLEAEIQLKLKPVAEDWRKLEPRVDADLKDGHIADALAKLSDFQTENAGLVEAAKAGERIDALCTGMLANAEKLAASGYYKEAKSLLSISAKLPEKPDAAFKTAIADYDVQIKQHQDLADVYEHAVDKALYYDPVPKTRFQFLDAAKVCTDAAAKPRNEPIRKEIIEMAELFKIADRVFIASKNQFGSRQVELPSLGTYNSVRVIQWDDRGLMYVPVKINLPPQPFTWESATAPEVVFQVVKEMKKSELDKPATQWELGVFAFAMGLQTPAGKIMRDLAKDDSPYKMQTGVALKVLKPADHSSVKLEKLEHADSGSPPVAPSLEDDARVAFKDLLDAKKADNKEKVKAIRADLDGKFVNTDFVKAHKKELDEPAVAAVVEPAKVVEAPKPVEKPKAPEVPLDEKEARDLLKANGWTQIIGTWVWDKTNNGIRVDGVAEVVNPALEGDVSVRFRMLDSASKIRVLTRVDNTAAADRFAGFGGKTCLGFGADVNNERAFVYMDWQSKKGSSKDPVQYAEVKLEQRPFQTIDLMLHGNKMFVYVNSKENKTTGDARNSGDTRVIVSGPVLFTVLKISNTK